MPAKPAVRAIGKTVDGTLRTADGRDRTYRIYVPFSVNANTPAPLLLALHGGTGWGKQFQFNSGFDGIAEANQFLVVYPDGIPLEVKITPDGRTWNGGDCCGNSARDNVDDVGFLVALIEKLVAEYAVDATRVFAAGHSNGGIMSYRLACERPDKIRAIGLQAGWIALDSCTPSRPVSALHIHGTADKNAPFDGGRGAKSISGTGARAAMDSTRMFATGVGCAPTHTDTQTGPITTIEWDRCPPEVHVRLLKIEGASHAWMGHPGRPAGQGSAPSGEPYQGLDSSAEIWSFLATQ